DAEIVKQDSDVGVPEEYQFA
nr:LCP1=major cuticular protein {N-terminal} [Ceratitis capitata=Mediterranean fruit flies, cuticle, third instar larvae, Peptide Partial, 20 aa] [Ceratitis capitata]